MDIISKIDGKCLQDVSAIIGIDPSIDKYVV